MKRQTHSSGEFAQSVLKILAEHPEGMRAKDVLTELVKRMPPTPFESADYPNRPGVRRFEKMARFKTIVPVQAGWMTKIKGIWAITDKGLEMLDALPDPQKLGHEIHRLWIVWKVAHPKERKSSTDSKASTIKSERAGPSFSWMEYVPPTIANLREMALNSDKAQEFEQAVMKLFRMLGFQVEKFGQGKGRQPDGIATAREFGYAILFDAKSSKEGFSFGTEDRAIIEYIQTHKRRLLKEGIDALYFALISSSFRGDAKSIIQKIRLQTNIQAVVLITAEQALQLLAHHINDPLTVDLENLKTLFMNDGPITAEEIDDLLSQD